MSVSAGFRVRWEEGGGGRGLRGGGSEEGGGGEGEGGGRREEGMSSDRGWDNG